VRQNRNSNEEGNEKISGRGGFNGERRKLGRIDPGTGDRGGFLGGGNNVQRAV